MTLLIKDNSKTIKNTNEQVSSEVALFTKHNVYQCISIYTASKQRILSDILRTRARVDLFVFGLTGNTFENF